MDAVSGPTIAFLAPMPPELAPLRKRLALEADGKGRHATHRGRHGDRRVVALLTGMGMNRAEARVGHLLEHHDVDHVIVIGIAGGIGSHLAIGDVVVPEVVIDRRDGREVAPAPLGPITPSGRLLSGDELVKDPARLARLRDEGAYAIDMETAAIGRICEDEGVPWSVFRGISDDAFDPAVNDQILALNRDDGTPDLAAVARFLARDPRRAVLLARLGRDLAKATNAAVDAALDATR